MTRDFFEVLILLKIILYSNYESRHKRRHESYIAALFRWLIPRHEARVQAGLSGHIERHPRLAKLLDRRFSLLIDLSHTRSHSIAKPSSPRESLILARPFAHRSQHAD